MLSERPVSPSRTLGFSRDGPCSCFWSIPNKKVVCLYDEQEQHTVTRTDQSIVGHVSLGVVTVQV